MLHYLKNSAAAAIIAGLGLATPAMAQSAAELAVRMSQLEDQMRQLVGQVEQLSFELQQLRQQKQGGLGAQPESQPMQKQVAEAPATEQGSEEITDVPLGELGGENGASSEVDLNKAPGPTILGTMKNSAAEPEDGGFQGQVLVAPAQQEAGVDNNVDLGASGNGANPDAIETVALAPESPEALYERSNESLLRRQFSEAEAGFRDFIQKYPDHDLAGSAQYWLGETYYALNDYRQAAQSFLEGYKKYPKSRRAPDSLLKLGISLGRLGQKQQSCAAYAAVSSEYPKAAEARKRAQQESKRAGCEA